MVPSNRQDAWSRDEDLLLAEVVLRHIREGGTQLQAFEEVGKQLSRTAAACGFRWNSYVRKQYKTGIELAKKQRKELKKQVGKKKKETPLIQTEDRKEPAAISSGSKEKSLSFDEVIEYLKGLYSQVEKTTDNNNELEKYKNKVHELEKKIYQLAAENEKLTKELKLIEEDYTALIEIMERARKMVVLQEEDRQQKVKFQMEKNGNLERVEK